MSTDNRPLSPHLQVYRPQLTAVLSITHRMTGVALAVGTLVLVYWLVSAAGGAESYRAAQAVLDSWLVKLLLFGWTFALYYHLANGLRHLYWDTGNGFDLETVYLSGKIVVGTAAVLTVLTWIIA
jgi:succinate dehydrogenase / fumarate reductase cytochrome b subunit